MLCYSSAPSCNHCSISACVPPGVPATRSPDWLPLTTMVETPGAFIGVQKPALIGVLTGSPCMPLGALPTRALVLLPLSAR